MLPILRNVLAVAALAGTASLVLSCSSKSGPAAAPTAPGPTATADAGEVFDATYNAGPFTVAAGTEMVMCTFVKGQNMADEDVQTFLAEQSVGGHHLIVYTMDHPVDLPPTPCSQGGQPGWVQVIGTQDMRNVVDLPAGVGFHVKANQQFVMETHYINATDASEVVQSSFALKYSAPGTVTQDAHAYLIGSMNINLAPNATAKLESTCTPPAAINLFSMAGHEHRYGTGVTVGMIPKGMPEQPLYATQQWDSPPAKLFGPALSLGVSDALHVTCDWNNTGTTSLSYPDEMCFAVGFFWPGPGALQCASAGGDADCSCAFATPVDTGPGGSSVEVTVSANDTISGEKGDPTSAGHPIYCTLWRAQDWPPTATQPKNGTQQFYDADIEGVALTSPSVSGKVTFTDVTPGDYSVLCFMDTISGGAAPGTGDPLNFPLIAVTATTGKTAEAVVTLNTAL